MVCMSSMGSAHEFWIDPETYVVQANEKVKAYLRNGEDFKGISYPYFPNQTQSFEWHQNGQTNRIDARIGDSPAGVFSPTAEGLVVISHQSVAGRIEYHQQEKLDAFWDEKDLRNTAENGTVPIKEDYIRYSKSLLSAGHGHGMDGAIGLRAEFIALTNPYHQDNITVQLLFDGTPRLDHQISVFAKSPEGEVTKSVLRSDAEGKVRLGIQKNHHYLLDAVFIEPGISSDWITHWASLTFQSR